MEGSSIVIDDPDVLSVSDDISIEEIPDIQLFEKVTSEVTDGKKMCCSKCGEKFSAGNLFVFHSQHCEASDESSIGRLFWRILIVFF